MTGTADIHPQKSQLLEFGLGKLGPSESAEIEHHLEACSECCDTLLNLQDDTFLSLVRKSPSPVHCPTQADTGIPRSDTAPDEMTALGSGMSLQATVGSGSPPVATPATEELAAELRQHPRYELQELIGHGGMGDVYRARHKLMHRTVALKVIRPELVRNEAAVKRFHREVQAAARLQHSHIVTAHDAEQAGNVHFLVMEYVAGVNLHEVIRDRGALPVAEACEYVRQVAQGLQHAHELGMVHRDIKPHNLMLTASGQVKILDFGLANFASEAAAGEQEETTAADVSAVPYKHQLTQSGTMMGTPDYIAPEQARDAHEVDIRADIYSLGCTFYTLLTGQAPFAEGSVLEKIQAHSRQEAPPVTKFRRDVPPELDPIVRKMMAKNPDERYQTPGEVAAALVKLIDVIVEQKLREQTAAGKAGRNKSPRTLLPWLIGLAAVGFVLLLGGIIIVTDRGRLEIQSEVQDVKISVLKGGQEVEVLDLKTGTQIKWLPTGEYELKLVGDNGVKLDRDGFILHRLGKIIVTARWDGSGQNVIRSFSTKEPTITRDNVETADGGWKITAPPGSTATTVRLFEVPMSSMKPGPFFYRAKLRCENLQGRAYLEMWTRFPGQGEFFSKGFHNAISGDSHWAEYEIPMYLQKGQQPDLVKLNLTIEGVGTVWIKDVELRGRSEVQPSAPEGEPAELRLVRKFPGHTGQVKQVVFSPDGKLAASISGYPESDHTVRLWDVATGQEVHKLVGLTDKGICVAFTPDGKQVLAAGWDSSVRFWDVQSGRQVRLIPGTQAVDEFLQVPEQDLILISYLDHLAAVKLDGNHTVLWRHDVKDRIMSLALCKDGRRFLAGDSGRGLTLRNLADGSVLDTYEFPMVVLEDLAVSPDGKTALLAGHGSHALHFEIDSGKLLHQWPTGTTRTTRFSPDGRFAAFADELIQIFDLSSGEEVAVSPETDARYGYWSLTYSANGQQILAAGSNYDRTQMKHVPEGDYALRLWELPKKLWPNATVGKAVPADANAITEVQRFSGHQRTVRCIAVSPDGRLVVSASGLPFGDNTARIWDRETGKVLHVLQDHRVPVVCAGFTPDGSRLLTGDVKGQLILWNPQTAERVARWGSPDGSIVQFVFSPDGQRVYFVRSGPRAAVQVVDPANGKPVTSFPLDTNAMPGIALTPDGSQLAVPLTDGSVQLIATDSGEKIRTFPAPDIDPLESGEALAVTVSPDGKILAAGYKAHTVRLWNLGTGDVIRDLRTDNFTTTALAFLGDNRRLITCGPVTSAHPDSPAACLLDIKLLEVIARTPATLGDGHAFALVPNVQQILTAGGAYFSAEENNWKETGDFDLRLWQLPGNPAPEPKPETPPFSRFFQTLENLPALARKAAADEAVFLTDITSEEPAEGMILNRHGLEAKITGEEDRGKAVVTALRDRFKTLAKETGAFVSHLSEDGQDNVQGSDIAYTAPGREGLIRLELEFLNADKRMPNIKNWKLRIRVEEWPREEKAATEPANPVTLILGDWTESNDPNRKPVHTFKFLDSGEYHESGPAVLQAEGGSKQWLTKDLDGDGKEEIIPFFITGVWKLEGNQLLTTQTGNNFLGFIPTPGAIRRLRVEELTPQKLVLTWIENDQDAERWTFFRPAPVVP